MRVITMLWLGKRVLSKVRKWTWPSRQFGTSEKRMPNCLETLRHHLYWCRTVLMPKCPVS